MEIEFIAPKVRITLSGTKVIDVSRLEAIELIKELMRALEMEWLNA